MGEREYRMGERIKELIKNLENYFGLLRIGGGSELKKASTPLEENP